MRRYNLPEGGTTKSVDQYVRVWSYLADRFNKLIGTKTIGYNPGFLFDFEGRPVDLSVSFVKKVIELGDKK